MAQKLFLIFFMRFGTMPHFQYIVFLYFRQLCIGTQIFFASLFGWSSLPQNHHNISEHGLKTNAIGPSQIFLRGSVQKTILIWNYFQKSTFFRDITSCFKKKSLAGELLSPFFFIWEVDFQNKTKITSNALNNKNLKFVRGRTFS